jgi:hypothetical protein
MDSTEFPKVSRRSTQGSNDRTKRRQVQRILEKKPNGKALHCSRQPALPCGGEEAKGKRRGDGKALPPNYPSFDVNTIARRKKRRKLSETF